MLMAAFTSALAAKPQAVHRNTAWLSREPRSTRPHAEHRWLGNPGLISSTRPGALSSSRRTSKPHPEARIPPRAFRGSRHFLDLQVFDPDQVEPPREIRAGLLGRVLA